MYPDEKPKQYDYPVDYLNQIAPQTNKRSTGPNLKLIVLILGLLAVLAVAFMLVASLSSKPNNDQRLAARLSQTATIIDESHKNIKSSHLRSLNSNLGIILTNTNRDLGAHLINSGIDPKKLSASATAPEATEAAEVKNKLETARLNAEFDRTYAREMAYRLETINSYLKIAYDNSSSAAYKDFLLEASKNIQPIYQQIADFNETGI
jgi:hypothetical protein